MKKLICLLGHNKRLMRLNECDTEYFENDDKSIALYSCKYCGEFIFAKTRYVKAKVNELYFDDVNMFD